MIKYIKSETTRPLKDYNLSKMLLLDDSDPTPENIWIKVHDDEPKAVLQNAALSFYPFASWGVMLPKADKLNVQSIKDTNVLELHPEAWQTYLEQGVMDEEGNPIFEPQNNSEDATK